MKTDKKICVLSLGCKVNQYDSEGIMARFSKLGFSVTDSLSFADIYIINTCAVTNEAEHKSRQMISRVKKYNKDAKIYICGCSTQNNPEPFKQDGVVCVLGTTGKTTTLVDKVLEDIENENFEQKNYILCEDLAISRDYENIDRTLSTMTRHYIKVQDGCDNYCSYCLIPYVRGHCRSQAIENVVDECKRAAKLSRELIIIGINLSAYGVDINSSLKDLIISLKDIDARIRLGSLEVNVINREFLEATKSLKKFCPHFHLSLQSGDVEVLKKMNRHYKTEDYFNAVQLIREYYPNAAITTDIIVGFPTETDEQFINSMNFARKVEFADIHVFTYSKRDGTIAAKYKQINGSIKGDRQRQMSNLKQELINNYLDKQIGKTLSFIPETKEKNYWVGHTDNYVKVYCENVERGNEYKVKILEKYNDGLIGILEKS